MGKVSLSLSSLGCDKQTKGNERVEASLSADRFGVQL